MKSLTPQQIVGGLNRHESTAFDRVYKQYFPYVAALARRLTNNSIYAEDIAQDSFVRLHEQTGRFGNLEKIRHYLHNTTLNNCSDYIRHQRIVSAKSEEIAHHYLAGREEPAEASDTMASYISILYHEMEKLPKKSRRISFLLYKEGLSNREIAKRMNLSEKTVANHKTLAVKFLKAEVLKSGLYSLILFLLKLLR
jgi:RNA polymerase sigma-70 factor (ECF subfamily)